MTRQGFSAPFWGIAILIFLIPVGLRAAESPTASGTTSPTFDKADENGGAVEIGTFSLSGDFSKISGFQKLHFRNEKWYDSTFWTGPDWTRVGKNWQHSGNKTASVRRFTCPRKGTLSVTGRVYKLDTTNQKGNDGVIALVLHNGQCVWRAEIDGTDATGTEPNLTRTVQKGDTIRFVIHKRGSISFDTTHWNPTIGYLDGEKKQFRASEQYVKHEYFHSPWSFEMIANEKLDAPTFQVYQFESDLSMRSGTLEPNQTLPHGKSDTTAFLLATSNGQQGKIVTLTETSDWRLRLTRGAHNLIHLQLVPRDGQTRQSIAPAASDDLPSVVSTTYEGTWLDGVRALAEQQKSEAPFAETFRRQFSELAKAIPTWEPPTADFWALLQQEWQQEDRLAQGDAAYGKAIQSHLERGTKLLTALREEHGETFLKAEAQLWNQLAKQAETPNLAFAQRETLYRQIRLLKRHIALSNPLTDFGPMLFTKRVPSSYSHLVMQYFGWRARPGGGIFVLDRPGHSLECHDLLDGKLDKGNVLEPRLSYDGKKIVFSYVECEDGPLNENQVSLDDPDERYYHLFEINVDGTGLRQITSGPYDDLMPTYLPDGGLAFSSTRRRGYARCFGTGFGKRWSVYTLHRVETDGSHLRTLSVHDTNEWFPTVSNTGHILYSRWDYIDRDAVTHQNLWASRPDGTNPIAIWGNASLTPHCTFQLQPIPGSNKIVFIASAHHSITAGSLAIVDPSVHDNSQAAITRLTPEIPFPEAESHDIREYYTSPWPLSEQYFLVGYSPFPLVWEPGANKYNALGLYLFDAFGNRELIYRDPTIGSENPCPLRARPMPPILVDHRQDDGKNRGEMILADIYQGLGDCERGTIKKLRIVQILPKTTPFADKPAVGVAFEENTRAILGTVPVEADGSARFWAPAGKPLLFQALDENGLAYQTMRTITYLQPGERVSCVGCHESRMTTPQRPPHDIMALNRRPSEIDPGDLGGRAWSYVEVVQPVLNRHCVCCHCQEKPEGNLILTGVKRRFNGPWRRSGDFSESYVALCTKTASPESKPNSMNPADFLIPRFRARNRIEITTPGGKNGARGSRLIKLLQEGHHDVKLSTEEMRRLGTWIDLNATFYGVNRPEEQRRQLEGERLPIPAIQ